MSGQEIANYAQNFQGVPYVFGGTTPSGFDCSGFVQYVYKHFGHVLSRTTSEQINNGREVGRSELQVGDLVFPTPGHVTIFLGNDFVIHAPRQGQVVKIEKLWAFWRARRIVFSPPPLHLQIQYNNKSKRLNNHVLFQKMIGNKILKIKMYHQGHILLKRFYIPQVIILNF